ncbi:MAG: hypothetical protein ABIH46_07380 [Chloroflexota bacterium]
MTTHEVMAIIRHTLHIANVPGTPEGVLDALLDCLRTLEEIAAEEKGG